jgi:hypothetical protein
MLERDKPHLFAAFVQKKVRGESTFRSGADVAGGRLSASQQVDG